MIEEVVASEEGSGEEAGPAEKVELSEHSSREIMSCGEDAQPREEDPKEESKLAEMDNDNSNGIRYEEAKPVEEQPNEESMPAQEINGNINVLDCEEAKPTEEHSNEESKLAEEKDDNSNGIHCEEAKPADEHPHDESASAEKIHDNSNVIDCEEAKPAVDHLSEESRLAALRQAMDDNNVDVVLKLYTSNLHQSDSSGRSLLAWAMAHDCHELIQRLSESGVIFDPEILHRELELSDPYHRHHTLSMVLQLAEHQRIGFCQTHASRPVQAWCNTCNVPICNWCMGKRGEHKEHDTDADLNACFQDHKDDFLKSLQEVDENVQAVMHQCQEDASNGQRTIKDESDAAYTVIDASLLNHASALLAQNQRDDEEIEKLQARINELQAAKDERQRQREDFDKQAQAVKLSLSIDAQRHCESVDAWQQFVQQKMNSASARASTWRKAMCAAMASRPNAYIDVEALTGLRARKETQTFLANQEHLQLPTFPDAVQMATVAAQSASKSFQEAVNDCSAKHSQAEEQKTFAFLMLQKVQLEHLQPKTAAAVYDAGNFQSNVTAAVDDAVAAPAPSLNVTDKTTYPSNTSEYPRHAPTPGLAESFAAWLHQETAHNPRIV